MTKEFGDWRLRYIESTAVSTLIAPHINGIIKEAAAQSGLMGEDSTRMSDTLIKHHPRPSSLVQVVQTLPGIQ